MATHERVVVGAVARGRGLCSLSSRIYLWRQQAKVLLGDLPDQDVR
jgi:hypothetical protein